MDLITFLILTLATWRLTNLLVSESGPFDMFARIRSRAGVYLDEWSEQQADNVIGKLLSCVWCCSVWVGFGLTLGVMFVPTVTLFLCLPFALSAGAILIKGWVQNG